MPVNKLRKFSTVSTESSNTGAIPAAGGTTSTPMKNVYPLIELGSGGALSDGDYGNITVSGGGTAMTIDNSVVTNAMQANMAANTYKANGTGSAAAPQDIAVAAERLVGRGASGNLGVITLGTNLSFSGTTLNATGSTADTIGTHNGATFRYAILTGTPTVTYDTTTPTAPVLTVAGGTIKLKELWVPYTSGGSTDPIFLINGTVSANRAYSTPLVTKIIENSTTPTIAGTYNQQDTDNTPQIRFGDYTATSVSVQLAAVTGSWNFGFLFSMNQ